jgi:hypothetical protein
VMLPMEPQEALAPLSECVNTKTVNPTGGEANLTGVLARWLEGEGIPVETSPPANGGRIYSRGWATPRSARR